MEACYHVPVSIWAIRGLLQGMSPPICSQFLAFSGLGLSVNRSISATSPYSYPTVLNLRLTDDPLIPLHLLIYATQTAVSTSACIADSLTWSISASQKFSLSQLYVPYLLLCK